MMCHMQGCFIEAVQALVYRHTHTLTHTRSLTHTHTHTHVHTHMVSQVPDHAKHDARARSSKQRSDVRKECHLSVAGCT